MKNVMKKMLSAALSGCMALSAMGGISAMAAGTEDADLIVFEDNFEDSSNISLKQPSGTSATWTEETGTANHYVHHDHTWAPYAIDFDRPVSTTKFKVQYDFYYDGTSAAVFVGDLDGMGSKDVASSKTMTIMYVRNDTHKIVAFNDDNPGTVYKAADGTSEATLTSGTWYSYSATLNTANRKMTATITERGKTDVVAALNDATCPYKAANMANKTWGGWAVAGTNYENLMTLRNCNLDNVKVSEIPDPETPIVFEEDFDGETPRTLRKAGDNNTIISAIADPTNSSNKYMKYAVNWDSYGFDFDRPIATSKFTVNYDFYYEAGKSGGVFVGDFDGKGSDNVTSSTVMTIMWYSGSTGKIAAFNDGNGPKYKDASDNDATLTTETWYSYSATLDTANRRLTAAITEKGTNTPVASFDRTADYKEDKANGIYSGYAIADTSYTNLMVLLNGTLDNIKVSEVHEAPVVTSVKFKDVHGNAMNNFTERVKSVDIAFSDKMDKSTMNADNISLTNNGSAVSYTGKLSGDRKTYTMTFDGISAGSAVLSMSNLKSAYYDMAEYSNTFKVLGKNSLFEEDFEAYAVQDEYPYVRSTVGSYKPYVAGTTKNKYMKVDKVDSWVDVWAFDYTNAVPTANFNVQYDFYYEGNNIAVFTGDIKDYAARRKAMTLMYVNDLGKIYALNDGNSGFVFKAEDGSDAVLTNGWYTYSASLDTQNRRIAATIAPKGKDVPVASLDATSIYKNAANDNAEVWYGWAMEGTEYKNLAVMYDAMLDNIKVEYNPNSIDALTITDGETTTVNSFADIKDGNWKVNLSTENTDGVTAANVVIAAIYDANGKLLDALTKPAELSAYYLGSKEVDFGNVTLPAGAASVKIMYWNGLDKCNPLTQGINF